MRRRPVVLGLAAALVAAAAAFLGGVLAGEPSAQQAPVGALHRSADGLVSGFASGDTAAQIAQLEARVEKNPEDASALTLLGLTYQQRARETGDPSFYPRSEKALVQALRLAPRNHLTLTGLATLAASRHRFGESLAFARRARTVNPASAAAHGIEGDALVELGRYRAAFAAFERSVAAKPTVAGYARVSYARELIGRTRAAKRAMQMAVDAAGPLDDQAAWALVQLGNLDLERGRLGAAATSFEEALRRSPDYAPALAGLARRASWQGRLARARELFERALAAQPLPEYAVALGDVLVLLGRDGDAEQAFRRAEQLEDAFAANGGANELETALFDLDHGWRTAAALARARAGREARPSVEGEHVLAWALFHNRRCEAARRHSVRALRLGTKDWGAMIHRSLIERCLGNERAAKRWQTRALDVNPYALEAFGPLPSKSPRAASP